MPIVAEFVYTRLFSRVRYVITEDKLVVEATGPLRGVVRNERSLSGIDPDYMLGSVTGGRNRQRIVLFLAIELAAGVFFLVSRLAGPNNSDARAIWLWIAVTTGVIGVGALLTAFSYTPQAEWAQYAAAGQALSILHNGKHSEEFQAFLQKLTDAVREARARKDCDEPAR